ncbi:MAG: hypothetical protein HY648_10025 [Acidobacteria bacterium]|nr:hypothetical protein [Acidobacteriota bacterium]
MFEQVGPVDVKEARRKRLLWSALAFALLLTAYLAYQFRNYAEERQARRFFQALQQQDFREAYRLWQPGDSYSFKDFMEDWGPDGFEGPVRQFRITGSTARGTGVVVRVRVNRRRAITLWVEKKDKSLSFPP